MTRTRTNDRREEIMDAASRLFSDRGFTETTLNDIMGELGVSGAAYYYYFEKKEDVLEAILDRSLKRVEIELDLALDSVALTAAQKLGTVIRAHAYAIASNAEAAAVLFNEVHRAKAGFAHQIRTRMRVYTHRLVELYAEGVSNGELIDEDPRLAIYCLLGQANWISQWYPSQRLADPDRVATAISQMALREVVVNGTVNLPPLEEAP